MQDPLTFGPSLLQYAESYAKVRGFSIDPNCLSNLGTLLNSGTIQAFAVGLPSNDSTTPVALAQSVRHLIDLMIEVQRSATALGPATEITPTLHEWTLSGALLKFCPCFPFC